MAVNVSFEQSYAYAEILEILSFADVNLIKKVPKKLISLFQNNALSTYEHHLDGSIPLENQDISSETATLLTLISLNYWCTPEEKKELQNILQENEKAQQLEIEEKYSVDNLFNNTQENNSKPSISNIDTNSQTSIENNLPIDTKQLPWYKKIIMKINEIISKLKK